MDDVLWNDSDSLRELCVIVRYSNCVLRGSSSRILKSSNDLGNFISTSRLATPEGAKESKKRAEELGRGSFSLTHVTLSRSLLDIVALIPSAVYNERGVIYFEASAC
jgi:hypothetical protein